MNELIRIEMVGAPVACAKGVTETWRDVAEWAHGKLAALFGERVHFVYYDLFDPECPQLPTDAQLPYIQVAGEMVINGGKVSLPLLRRKVESLLQD